MKKVALVLLSILLLWGAGGNIRAESADIVVLMDASGTILPWFDQINNRILVDITRKFVRKGDTFHLISFNSRSNLEIVQPVVSETDVSRIVSRFMLLYPIGQNSDFVTGLQYTWQYVNTLDQQRQKIVIVISDGIFNPPESSQYASFSPDQVNAEIGSYARKIRGAGWSVYYIKLPFPENATVTNLDGATVSLPGNRDGAGSDSPGSSNSGSSGVSAGSNTIGSSPGSENSTSVSSGTASSDIGIKTPDYVDVSGTFTQTLGVDATPLPEGDIPLNFVDSVFDLPEITFPKSLGKTGRSLILPLDVRNSGAKPVNLELIGIMLGNANILQRHAFLSLEKNDKGTLKAEIGIPDSIGTGEQSLTLSLQFAGNTRVHPQEGTVSFIITSFSPLLFLRQGGSIAFAAILVTLAAAFVALLIILVIRHTAAPAHRALNEVESVDNGYARQSAGVTSVKQQAAPNTATGSQYGASPASDGKPSIATPKAHEWSGQQTTRPDKTLSAGMVAAGWSGSEILKTEKKDKTINFNVSQDKTIAFSAEKDTKADSEVKDLLLDQARLRREGYAILTQAAHKGFHPSHIPAGADPDEAIPVLEKCSKMFELQVRYQTRMIGKRNIHVMKAGSRLSLGGGVSSFLVFLVKFPQRIADIRFDGQKCSLAILKPAYFPFETENIIHDCVDREFIIVSDKDYEVRFTIKEYEDPVVTINRLLTSIRF